MSQSIACNYMSPQRAFDTSTEYREFWLGFFCACSGGRGLESEEDLGVALSLSTQCVLEVTLRKK